MSEALLPPITIGIDNKLEEVIIASQMTKSSLIDIIQFLDPGIFPPISDLPDHPVNPGWLNHVDDRLVVIEHYAHTMRQLTDALANALGVTAIARPTGVGKPGATPANQPQTRKPVHEGIRAAPRPDPARSASPFPPAPRETPSTADFDGVFQEALGKALKGEI